jgi:hypothetical protein
VREFIVPNEEETQVENEVKEIKEEVKQEEIKKSQEDSNQGGIPHPNKMF